jgi:hypothetical protein
MQIKGETNWRGSGPQKIGCKTQVAEATGAYYVAAGSERANMEDIEKTLGDAKANLAKVLVAAELLDLAHRRIVARKVYQLAHLIWNVPYMGGRIKLETMLKTLHDLTQIFYSEMMATQAKMTSGAFLDEAAIRYINTEDVKARLCGLVVAIENLFFQGKMPRRGRSEIKDMLLNFICGQLSEEEREIAREEIEADPKRIAGE